MKEATLRKAHRSIGIALALFIVLQAGSGVLLGVGEGLVHNHKEHPTLQARDHGHGRGEPAILEALEFVHKGGGIPGGLYRLIVGAGIVAMAASGSMIFLRTRSRAGVMSSTK